MLINKSINDYETKLIEIKSEINRLENLLTKNI